MAKNKETPVHAFILLDRSGSMSSRWTEALGSINAYVETISKKKVKGDKITLATFDTDGPGIAFDVIRDTAIDKWKEVTNSDASPRGMTPLFDAIGRIVALVEKENNEKSLLLIMTDGGENNSKEVTKSAAKDALDRCRTKGWEVIFLGADFDAMGEAAQVGTGYSKTLNMSVGNYASTLSMMADQTVAYARGGQSVSFSAEARASAIKPKDK